MFVDLQPQHQAVSQSRKRKRHNAIPDADLPVDLSLNNLPVEQYQQIYHQVVDNMLKYVGVISTSTFPHIVWEDIIQTWNTMISVSSAPCRFRCGRPRPYSLALGRRIKQRLWEALGRPLMSCTGCEGGRTDVILSHGNGGHAPCYKIDISREPKPQNETILSFTKCWYFQIISNI